VETRCWHWPDSGSSAQTIGVNGYGRVVAARKSPTSKAKRGPRHDGGLLEKQKKTRHLATAQMTYDVCDELLDARAVRAVPGPGGGRSAPR